jgi:hypothetical protein
MLKTLALAIFATTLASAAHAEPSDPQTVANLLRAMNSTDVKVEWIDDSTARVDAVRNGYNYTYRLMDCNADKVCASNMIFATFDMIGLPDVFEYQRINEYNDNYPFGRAFLVSSEDKEGYVVGVDYAFITSDENKAGEAEVNMFFVILDSFVQHMQDGY